MSVQNDNLSEKISRLMSDPESLKQIQELGAMLGLGEQSSSENKSTNKKVENAKQSSDTTEKNSQGVNFPDLSSVFGNSDISPDMINSIMKIMPLLSSMKNKSDKNTNLLNALRPFLSEKRQKKLDESSKLMSLLSILPKLKESGLF